MALNVPRPDIYIRIRLGHLCSSFYSNSTVPLYLQYGTLYLSSLATSPSRPRFKFLFFEVELLAFCFFLLSTRYTVSGGQGA
jgi:hypothetical protein